MSKIGQKLSSACLLKSDEIDHGESFANPKKLQECVQTILGVYQCSRGPLLTWPRA